MDPVNLSQLLSLPDFGKINVSTFITRPILSLVLFVYLVGYISLGSILFYHWRKYGMRSTSVIFAETAFLLVSLVLFVLAGVAVSYY